MTTTYFKNMIASRLMGLTTGPSLPQSYYVGLSTSTPTASGGGVTEPTGGGYQRVQFLQTNMSGPTSGVITNTNAISFPESTASWGFITNIVFYAGLNTTDLLMSVPLAPPKTAEQGTIVYFKPGDISVSIVDA
jgi:hypothetical protein